MGINSRKHGSNPPPDLPGEPESSSGEWDSASRRLYSSLGLASAALAALGVLAWRVPRSPLPQSQVRRQPVRGSVREPASPRAGLTAANPPGNRLQQSSPERPSSSVDPTASRRRVPRIAASPLSPTVSPPADVAGSLPGNDFALTEPVRRLCRDAEAGRIARWIGVYLASADAVDAPLAAYQAGDSFAAASVIKVSVMLALEARWDERSLAHTRRLEGLLQRMIRESDNNATRTLIRAVGRQRINAEVAHLLGTPSPTTVLAARRRSPHHGRRRNQANPREVARLLALISGWERSGRRSGAHMLGIMRRTAPRHRTRIPAGVPREYQDRVGNKTGTLADVVNDAAIVETPAGTRYVLCIFMEGVRSQGRAEAFCRSLSHYCWSSLASGSPTPDAIPARPS